MSLDAIQAAFESEIAESVRAYEELATTKTFARAADFDHEDTCMLEGVTSHIWQAWCRFCRTLIVDSCIGTTDASGNLIPQLPGALSEQHVSGAVIRIKNGRTPTWGTLNAVLRFEPTWGDIDVLTDIIRGTAPANATKISGMCTLASTSSRIIHRVRNASAHHNTQTMTELQRLSSGYKTFPIAHPAQALFWVDSSTGNYLLPEAIEGFIVASMFAVV